MNWSRVKLFAFVVSLAICVSCAKQVDITPLVQEYLPIQMLSAKGFEATTSPLTKPRNGTSEFRYFDKRSEKLNLNIGHLKYRDLQQSQESFQKWISVEVQRGTLSGNPLGVENKCSRSGRGALQAAWAENIRTQCGITKNGKAPITNEERRANEKFAEIVVRLILAKRIGTTLRDSNDSRAPGCLKSEANVVLAPASRWSSTSGLIRDNETSTRRGTINGKNILLCLAADKVQVNGEWRNLGAFVVSRDDEWYVPIDGILQAIAE